MHCPARVRPRALLIAAAAGATLAAGVSDAGGAAAGGETDDGRTAGGGAWSRVAESADTGLVTPSEAAAQLRAGGLPEAVADAPPVSIEGRTVDPELATGAHDTLAVEGGGAVDAAIGTDPADGFALATGAGTLRVVPDDVAPQATAATIVAGEAALYANTGPATDSVIRPTPTGIETFTQLRDPAAPTTTRYRIELAGDEHLTLLPEGGVGIVADSAVLARPPGEVPVGAEPSVTTVGQLLTGDPPVVAAAGPPTARDARGRDVPVAYTIEGDTLAVTAQPPADAAYPVTVDPSWTAASEPGSAIVGMSRDSAGVTTTTATPTTPVPWSSFTDEAGVDEKAVARVAGCFRRKVTLRRESIGIFLFGISLEKKWCGWRGRVRRQSREARASVGWNWDLIGRPRSGTRMHRRDYGESWAKAHFRLDYSPFYTQNKFPSVGLHFNSVGGSRPWHSCC